MSTDAPWRVYLPEWLVVWTSDALGPEGQAECLRHFQGKYQGRVREQDWRVIPAVFGMELKRSPSCVQLFVPNLRGEFKSEDAAWGLAGELKDADLAGGAPQVVQRGSPEEQELLDYSRKMLPATSVDGGKG